MDRKARDPLDIPRRCRGLFQLRQPSDIHMYWLILHGLLFPVRCIRMVILYLRITSVSLSLGVSREELKRLMSWRSDGLRARRWLICVAVYVALSFIGVELAIFLTCLTLVDRTEGKGRQFEIVALLEVPCVRVDVLVTRARLAGLRWTGEPFVMAFLTILYRPFECSTRSSSLRSYTVLKM